MAFWIASLACHLRYALIILCVILIVILFSKWTGGGPVAAPPVTTALLVKTAPADDVPPVATVATIHALVRQARVLLEKTSEQLQAATARREDGVLPSVGQLLQLGMQASYALCYVESAQQMLLATTGDDGAVLNPLVHSLEGLRDEIITIAGASSSSSSS
jgi:hypothetical protein